MEMDIVSQLANISPDSALGLARQTRDAATEHTQGSHDILFRDEDSRLPLSCRYHIARQVARWNHDSVLEQYYLDQLDGNHGLGNDGLQCDSVPLDLLEHFARSLTCSPIDVTAEDVTSLSQSGIDKWAIVTLAQLVGYVNYQTRVLIGLTLIQGKGKRHTEAVPVAGRWHAKGQTVEGKPAPAKFTTAQLGWEPWLEAKPLGDYRPDEQKLLKHFGHASSDYFRLLGINLPLLEQRTLIDRGVFYTPGGLPRAERELAATVVSRVNGCIYCASVHARKTIQFGKDNNAVETPAVEKPAVEKLLAVGEGYSLSEGQTERWQTLIDFAASLSLAPSVASLDQIAALRAHGLDDLELLDLVQSTAFFAWANRLMLTLGEPFLL